MRTRGSLGAGWAVVLALLAIGAIFSGVHAILADSVTTPAKIGDGKRVYGTDTILVGVGWILIGLAFTAKVLLARQGGHAGSVAGVILAVTGGLFWLAAL